MARTISNKQLTQLTLTLAVISELSSREPRPVNKAALWYCGSALLEIVAPARAPAAAVTQAAPAATAIATVNQTEIDKATVKARAREAALKAAATRKANKNKSADTATTIDTSDPETPATGPLDSKN